MLISDEYRDVCLKTHEMTPSWGTSQAEWLNEVTAFLNDGGQVSVLDYGCGKGKLAGLVGREMTKYDPAVEKFQEKPQPHDEVVCVDVLEHVEPDCLDEVLADVKSLIISRGFFTIDMRPARRLLFDGRNAHLILQPMEWWISKLKEYFTLYAVVHYYHDGEDYRMLVVVKQ